MFVLRQLSAVARKEAEAALETPAIQPGSLLPSGEFLGCLSVCF